LSFDGDGKISMFLGGYSDFLNHQSGKFETSKNKKKIEDVKKIKKLEKLSFIFQFELDGIPNEIASLQEEITSIKNELKDSNLYISNNDRFEDITKKLKILEKNFQYKEARWLELLEMEENIKKINEE
jgi:ATP-binding cassette subfamily F protein uup